MLSAARAERIQAGDATAATEAAEETRRRRRVEVNMAEPLRRLAARHALSMVEKPVSSETSRRHCRAQAKKNPRRSVGCDVGFIARVQTTHMVAGMNRTRPDGSRGVQPLHLRISPMQRAESYMH
jgi:hypothetical protein